MQNAKLVSPVAFAYSSRNPSYGVVNDVQTALSFTSLDEEKIRNQNLSICDVSCLNRTGVKGPQAENWIQSLGTILPHAVNSWTSENNGALVLRLGRGEFLIEDEPENALTGMINEAPVKEGGVHKVVRNDASFIVSGELTSALFSEVCAIDLDGGALESNRLVMTIIAGVSATMLKQTWNNQPVYRIWCDGTYGPYLWKTLLGITEEYGGGPVGFNFYYTLN